MLTYPSDPLPQIVCPMDEDAIPPNHFCSAPPHSDPPPPLPPFSSITPSCANDGICGHRRSGRIQGIRAQTPKKASSADSGAAQRPCGQHPPPSKKKRESGSMVQVSQAKQPRVESSHGCETQNEDGFDFDFASECPNEQDEHQTSLKHVNHSAAENRAEQFSDHTAQDLDATKSDMDTCGELTGEHSAGSPSSPKGWVIGPLFQSFKSKMASFTEIVMTPVKLFRANSPPPSTGHPDIFKEGELTATGPCDAEHAELSNMFGPEEQHESGNQADQSRLGDVEGTQNAQTVAIKYSKKLSFDVESSTRSSGQEEECRTTQEEQHMSDSVPLQHRPSIDSEEVSESMQPVFGSSVNASASREPELKSTDGREEPKVKAAAQHKPLPRKCTGLRKKVASTSCTSELMNEEQDFQLSHLNSVRKNKQDSSDVDNNSDSPPPDGADGNEMESCHLVRQSLRCYLHDSADGRILRPSLDAQQLECHLHPETSSAAGLGRTDRELKSDGNSQDSARRKRLTADVQSRNPKKQVLLNVSSDGGTLRRLRPQREEQVKTDKLVDRDDVLRPVRKRQAVSRRTNKKGKDEPNVLTAINEAVRTQTESSIDAMLVCSLEKSSVLSGDSQKGSNNGKVKPSGSCKRLKTQALRKPVGNIDNCMNLETTIAITSAKPAEQEQLPEVLIRPDRKQLQSTRKCGRPQKRKSPHQMGSATGSNGALSAQPLGEPAAGFNTSVHVGKLELNQPSKRSKKGLKSAASGGSPETKQCASDLHLETKEDPSQDDRSKTPVDSVYFEMTSLENNPRPCPPPTCDLDCSVPLSNGMKHCVDGKGKDPASVTGEVSNSESTNVSRLRSRGVGVKPRREDQRRKCRVLHSRTRQGEEAVNSVSKDDADLDPAGAHSSKNGLSRRLLRSYSCPEIPSLQSSDLPWTFLQPPHHSRVHTSHQQHSSNSPLSHHAHKSLRRARRHTVCSVEVEREIAPLCLRKEVYPSRRSVPYDGAGPNLSPSHALSPSTSLSALASCFLSSPLAFLSKKVDSRVAAGSPSTSSHVSSPTSSSAYPLTPSTWHLPGFLQRTDSCGASSDSSSSGIPLQCDMERIQQSEEEDDGENTSSSSQEFEDAGLREEKALSDSEIKVAQKHEERGKVSSIRIRKTLPKPQNNLTPMGLPRPIRLKKKEFSLEEIYTNKNFSKPPESRLETIFEVPLNRRNGSESWFGQRRVKRFLAFLEVGEVRKPKKPLVGVGKAGISSSRTRRGGFPKDEAPLSVQDVDSLLCAKLDQLSLWLMHDHADS